MRSSTGLVPGNGGDKEGGKGISVPTSSARLANENRGADLGGEPGFAGHKRSLQQTNPAGNILTASAPVLSIYCRYGGHREAIDSCCDAEWYGCWGGGGLVRSPPITKKVLVGLSIVPQGAG